MDKIKKVDDPRELEDWYLRDDYHVPPTLDLMACLGLWIMIGVGIVLEVLDK